MCFGFGIKKRIPATRNSTRATRNIQSAKSPLPSIRANEKAVMNANLPIYLLVGIRGENALGMRVLPDCADGTIEKFKVAITHESKSRSGREPLYFNIYDVANPDRYRRMKLIRTEA